MKRNILQKFIYFSCLFGAAATVASTRRLKAVAMAVDAVVSRIIIIFCAVGPSLGICRMLEHV